MHKKNIKSVAEWFFMYLCPVEAIKHQHKTLAKWKKQIGKQIANSKKQKGKQITNSKKLALVPASPKYRDRHHQQKGKSFV